MRAVDAGRVRRAAGRASAAHGPGSDDVPQRWTLGSGGKQRRRLDAASSSFLAHLPEACLDRVIPLLAAARRDADGLAGHGKDAEYAFAAGALASLAAEGLLPPQSIDPLTADLRDRTQVRLPEVGLRTLADPRLLVLPLEALLDVTLALLAALGPLRAPSVWVAGDSGTPRLLRWHGAVPAMVVPGLVTTVFAENTAARQDTWTALPVTSFQQPCAVLAFCHKPERDGQASALATTLGWLLSRAFERAALFNSAAEHAAVLVRSSERRMTRIGFDLHDGALQDVALMVGEIDALRDSLTRRRTHVGDDVIARVDDLAGLAGYLNENLREVANSLDATSEMRRPFAEALNGILRAFSMRAGIEPELEVIGEVDGLSESQRIALLRVAQECLTNIREHSRADRVRIAITVGSAQVDATIEDNGIGFEVDAALRDSARRGRMGLIGIVERIRLLGGFCDINSQPGEGCRVSLSVQRWTPEMAAEATAAKLIAG